MFWALMAWYFFGGGSDGGSGALLTTTTVSQIRESVAIVVEDPARSAAAKATLDDMGRISKRFEKAFSASGKKLYRAYRDYDARGDAVDAVLEELNREWAADQQQALDLRFELRDTLTREEWAELFAPAPPGESH